MKIAISHLEYEGKSQQEQSLIRRHFIEQTKKYFNWNIFNTLKKLNHQLSCDLSLSLIVAAIAALASMRISILFPFGAETHQT